MAIQTISFLVVKLQTKADIDQQALQVLLFHQQVDFYKC